MPTQRSTGRALHCARAERCAAAASALSIGLKRSWPDARSIGKCRRLDASFSVLTYVHEMELDVNSRELEECLSLGVVDGVTKLATHGWGVDEGPDFRLALVIIKDDLPKLGQAADALHIRRCELRHQIQFWDSHARPQSR